VILKHTIKDFPVHPDEYYRDKTSKRQHMTNDQVEAPIKKDLRRFYKRRYFLFSKYDRGVHLDEEGWYSVTPEVMAKHIASRVTQVYGEEEGTVIDAFCGVGGNLIQFGRKCHFAVGIDMDPVKLECSRHNAEIYGAEDKVQLLGIDFLKLQPSHLGEQHIDAVFLSPPWGGTGYTLLKEYTVDNIFPDFG